MTPAETLKRLHEEVDHEAARLVVIHAGRLHCQRGCSSCCVDDLTVHVVEADRIRAQHPDLLAAGVPHPEGGCAFLDGAGACRIYDARPYVCRTQGLPLRWLDVAEDDEGTVEFRDICPLNDPGEPPIEQLPPESCWTLGPAEERLALIQQTADQEGPARPRVRLRDLFTATGQTRVPPVSG